MTVSLQSPEVPNYEQFQVDIAPCGVDNPVVVMSSGTATTPEEQISTSSPLNTSDLSDRFYEVVRIRLHSPRRSGSTPEHVDFLKTKDFPRLFFEVRGPDETERTPAQIAAEVAARERKREERFLSGLDASPNRTGSRDHFCVFCFVTDVSLRTRMRFDRWEILPFRGLDSSDHLVVVNEFLATRTKLPDRFDYTESMKSRSRAERPVFVAHFPLVLASSDREAADFCIAKAALLTEVLSFYRQAVGSTLSAVTMRRETGECHLFMRQQPYRGNLLGGPVSGEDPDTVRFLVERLETDLQLRYFISLYRNARGETNASYAYLRYWQLLETIAESKNFNKKDVLVDEKGLPLLDKKGRQRRASGGVGIVYRLLFDSLGKVKVTFGDPVAAAYTLMDFVEGWAAMRNAAAHFGGFSAGDPIQQKHFGGYTMCQKVVSDQRGLEGFVLSHLVHQADLIVGGEIQERLDELRAERSQSGTA
jgi:hypothetical protein